MMAVAALETDTTFQFTPLREGRRHSCDRKERDHPISIHAPPRGATVFVADGQHDKLFQFTPLREGRRPPAAEQALYAYFNSRPSARGDPHDVRQRAGLAISIHAPPRGAT